jgi:hypothetical protein
MKEQIDRIIAIREAIKEYSIAYNKFEVLQIQEEQLKDRLLPKGDQKTGVIGEFYALQYLKKTNPNCDISLVKNHSQEAYDLKIDERRISVKTVSEWSQERKINLKSYFKSIKKTENKEFESVDLIVISLTKNLTPDGIWFIASDVIKEKFKGSVKVPLPNLSNNLDDRFGTNLISELGGL